jgi:CRISPR-associated endoribonuclease Cas6
LRLKIKFKHKSKDVLILPLSYNLYLQAFVYTYLDEWVSQFLHNTGFEDKKSGRRIKFFTFSRIIPDGKVKFEDKRIHFYGTCNLVISSPYNEFIQSFASNLLKNGIFHLAGEILEVISIEVEGVPKYSESLLVKTLSPITVYSTLITKDGKKKTYYYNPFEKEFEQLVIENLKRKARIWFNEEVDNGSIKPYKVSTKNEKIIVYKDTVIKGWDGIYEIKLPEKLFQLAFDAGLGSKNSQGFGLIEVWKEKT